MTKITNISYAEKSRYQKLDLYLPDNADTKTPLVVFIHGGGWYAGDKQDGQELGWVKLVNSGYAVASINYRLSGEVNHPVGIQDCKTAIRFLKANADKYNIDKNKVAVSGGSSGGHFALMLGVTQGMKEFEDLSDGYPEENSDVACIVAWYPAADIEAIYDYALGDSWTGFGANFAIKNIERYLGSSDRDEMSKASPINCISDKLPPIFLQHGDADDICPIKQTRDFYEKAKELNGDRIRFDILKNASHGDRAFSTDSNMEKVRSFLDEFLKY